MWLSVQRAQRAVRRYAAAFAKHWPWWPVYEFLSLQRSQQQRVGHRSATYQSGSRRRHRQRRSLPPVVQEAGGRPSRRSAARAARSCTSAGCVARTLHGRAADALPPRAAVTASAARADRVVPRDAAWSLSECLRCAARWARTPRDGQRERTVECCTCRRSTPYLRARPREVNDFDLMPCPHPTATDRRTSPSASRAVAVQTRGAHTRQLRPCASARSRCEGRRLHT